MATVVNNPAPTQDTGSGTGFLLGIIVLAVLVFLFLYYGLPAIQNTAPQIQVPGRVDVNVNTPNNSNP